MHACCSVFKSGTHFYKTASLSKPVPSNICAAIAMYSVCSADNEGHERRRQRSADHLQDLGGPSPLGSVAAGFSDLVSLIRQPFDSLYH